MFRVVVTHPIPDEGLFALRERCEVVLLQSPALLDAHLANCDALIAGGALTGAQIERAPSLKIVSNYGAGYDSVDVAAADAHGVIVTNIPDSTAESTAELAFSLMLDCRRRVSELDRLVRSGDPASAFGMGRFMGHNLRGATLGIIGMGRIGKRMASFAEAFGMRVVSAGRGQPIERLLRESDVVSLHCPLTPQTRSLIGRHELSLMKPSAVLVNTSRGAVVDSEALADALEGGQIAAAGLDVYPDEPKIPERLLALPNATLTPHIGANTHETRFEMARQAAERILCVVDGKLPPNIVNRTPAPWRARMEETPK